jgi:hypothetical protein
MTPENWTDLLATLRFIFDNVLKIITVVVGGLAAYYAYRSKTVGERNSGHLLQQDASIHAIGNTVEVLAASATPSDLDPLRSRVEGLTAQLEAIRREPGPGV